MKQLNKRAQVWSLDLIVACVIFMVGIVILYIYSINYTNQGASNLNNMLYDGNIASNFILSEDFPGILTNNKINQTKLDDFANSDYATKKRQLNSRYDFYFKIDSLEAGGNPVDYLGKMPQSATTDNIKITRFTIYKNKPAKFELFIWK